MNSHIREPLQSNLMIGMLDFWGSNDGHPAYFSPWCPNV